jgi:hypothetical protein
MNGVNPVFSYEKSGRFARYSIKMIIVQGKARPAWVRNPPYFTYPLHFVQEAVSLLACFKIGV